MNPRGRLDLKAKTPHHQTHDRQIEISVKYLPNLTLNSRIMRIFKHVSLKYSATMYSAANPSRDPAGSPGSGDQFKY